MYTVTRTYQGRIQDLKLGVAQNGLDWKLEKLWGILYIYIYIYVLKIRCSIHFKYDIYMYMGGGGGIVYMCLKYVIVYISNMIYIYIKYAFLLQYFI